MSGRNMPFRFIILSVIFIIGASTFFFTVVTLPLRTSVSVNRSTVLIGDSIRYFLTINARKDIALEIPDVSSIFKDFSVRNHKRIVEDSMWRRVYRYIYMIAKEDPGEYEIEPLTIRYKHRNDVAWNEDKVRGFSINVRGLLSSEDDSEGKIKIGSDIIGVKGVGEKDGSGERSMDIDASFKYKIKDESRPKNILTLQDVIFFVILGFGCLVLFTVGATFIYDKIFRKKIPIVPIDILALERIKKIEIRDVGSSPDVKVFCSALSFAVKDYLKRRFGMENREKTSMEFISEFYDIASIPDKHKEAVGKILSICDLVKYSDYQSNKDELSNIAVLAKDLVAETRQISVGKSG